MPIKIGMVSLGCSKNLVDSERMLYKFRKRGYELVTEPGLSDIAVVNTCGFIQSAKEEAIETILELVKLKEEGTIKKIVVTGCLSTLLLVSATKKTLLISLIMFLQTNELFILTTR